MSQRDAVQQIKARIKLVDVVRRYVELRHNGARWVAPCPFHQETKPSFSVNEEEGFFYCFGCQAAGDLFDFYGRINGLDFRETLEQLADEAGIRLEKFQGNARDGSAREAESGQRRRLLRMHELAGAWFKGLLAGPEGAECRDYMNRRGLSAEVAETFGLGYSPQSWNGLADTLRKAGFKDEEAVRGALLAHSAKSGRAYDRFRGRLMFPIRSLSGTIVAFGGRIIGNEDEAKYINSGDSPLYKKGEHLYGLQQARKAIITGKVAMLTEGYMDVVTLHQYGYTGAVGALGTALTPEQVKRLAGFAGSVELLFDGDKPGRKAALKAAEMFLVRGMSCKVVLFPEGEDIDSLLRSSGERAFEALRAQAPEGLAFCIRMLTDMAPRDAVEWARAFLARVEQPELLGRYASSLALGLGLSEQELRDGMVAARARTAADGAAGAAPRAPTTAPPIKQRLVDREIMTFAVRYPHELDRLKQAGAWFSLKEEWSRRLWDKMENNAPEDVFHVFDEREKQFWIRCRTGDAPPLHNAEGEFDAIRTMLEKMRLAAQSASVSAALRRGAGPADFETDLEYLRALQETLERTHGEH